MIRLKPLHPLARTCACAGCGEFSVVGMLVVNERVKIRLCYACIMAIGDEAAAWQPTLGETEAEAKAS